MTFNLSAIVFVYRVNPSTWKFILLSFYIRVQFCRFSRARYNVWPTTQLFNKRRKWIECCFYYSAWAWTCVSTYFPAGKFFLFPFEYDQFPVVGSAWPLQEGAVCYVLLEESLFLPLAVSQLCPPPRGREIVNFIAWLVGVLSYERYWPYSCILSFCRELVGTLGQASQMCHVVLLTPISF